MFKFWPLISPQGDGNEVMTGIGLYNRFMVLALNFPARGRKRCPRLEHVGQDALFWPLISPQGDGNG